MLGTLKRRLIIATCFYSKLAWDLNLQSVSGDEVKAIVEDVVGVPMC